MPKFNQQLMFLALRVVQILYNHYSKILKSNF
jgi:hypothetical protein